MSIRKLSALLVALIKKDSGRGEYYYLYNGHGDVIQLVERKWKDRKHDIAKSVGAAFIEPFRYLYEHSKNV